MDNNEKLKFIAKNCKASVGLSYREESDCYQKLTDMVVYGGGGNGEYYHESTFVDGEMERCVETDEYWCLHFYPDTPVGFYHAISHDLDKLLDWGVKIIKDERGIKNMVRANRLWQKCVDHANRQQFGI